MVYVNIHIELTKTSNHELDKDVDSGMMATLTDDGKLQDFKIMGAIFHPIFESKPRMVAVGLCTEMRYEAGRSDFWGRISYYFDGRDESPAVLLDPVERDEYDEVRYSMSISLYAKDAGK